MIRWPGMQSFDMLVLKRTETKFDINEWAKAGHWTVVYRDIWHDRMWVAPRWIGWLYRLLPNHFNVNLTGWKTEPSMYLANIGAPTWVLGIAMRSGIPAIVVHLGHGYSGFGHWYLPWGSRLYAKWTSACVWRRLP